MNNRTLIASVKLLKRGEQVDLAFLSPIVCAGLAAWFLEDPSARDLVHLSGDADWYSDLIGFSALLRGEIQPRPAASTSGSTRRQTMSPLTSLARPAEVESCNERVTSILRDTNAMTIEEQASAGPLRMLVGELHDNVASHANGRGYSALQVYESRAEFAVCDYGCGFLRNVRRVERVVDTHRDAIEWVLVRGNTTARPPDRFAQRSGPDWEEQAQYNHHMGIGLWRLVQLVERTSGELWIWSGDSTYHRTGHEYSFRPAPVTWPGVMIELVVPKLTTPPVLGDFSRDELDTVGSELGI